MATRTHTTYFSDGSLDAIRKEATELREDYEHRAPGITTDAAKAMELRLDILDAAISMLAEPVPTSYGG
jgi:hypothetical protein